jgi:Protein of unknown function (DUF2778)
LIRVGEMSVAAVWAGLMVSLYAWVMHGSEHADASTRAGSPALSVIGTTEPAPTDNTAVSLAPTVATASFEERFVFDQPTALSGTLRPSLSFGDRFGTASAPESVAVRAVAVAPSLAATVAAPAAPAPSIVTAAPGPRLAAAVPVPRPAPRSVGAPDMPSRSAGRYRLASLSDMALPSGDTPADVKDETTKDPNPLAGDMSHTAIYDISARMVYLPSGERLEAHSGLGGYMDDVRAVNLKKLGPTPPNVYELKLRERPFHGVQAIRLVPVAGSKMFGRDGILAHPFMLGDNGESNGCVSFKDYPAFLKAYQRGEITRIVVVEQLDDPPGGRTAADWFSSTLKKIFSSS